MKKLVLALLALCFTYSVQASAEVSCLQGNADEQMTCVQDGFKQSELGLNETYQKIVEALQNKQEYGNEKNFILENMSSRLRISQRGWIYFRAGQCEMEAFSKINKEHIISAQINCTTKMNDERTQYLKDFFASYLKMKF